MICVFCRLNVSMNGGESKKWVCFLLEVIAFATNRCSCAHTAPVSAWQHLLAILTVLGLMLCFRGGSSPRPCQNLAELVSVVLSLMCQNGSALLLGKKQNQNNKHQTKTHIWKQKRVEET